MTISADVNSGLSDTVSSFPTKTDFLDSTSGMSMFSICPDPPSGTAFSKAVVLTVIIFFSCWLSTVAIQAPA